MESRHVKAGLEYAEQVVAGTVAAAEPLRLACQRQLADLERWRGADQPYSFDERKAARICTFVEAMPHIKGKWARAGRGLIELQPWQSFLLTTIFGWIRADGTRRFRQVYIEVPRKNAKSTITSAVALFMLALDGEEGAEIYSAATTRDQAAIVFRDSMAMVDKSPEFCKSLGVSSNSLAIFQRATNSRFMALSSQDHRLDGLNPHFSMLDEVHAMVGRGLFDVLDTAMGARSQPLLWLITTAGSNQAGICYEQHQYVKRILQGSVADETYFGVIYTIDQATDAWDDPEVWCKANPNYGISVDPEDLLRQAKKAAVMQAAQSAFLTKRLNVWIHADSAWLDMMAWARGADSSLKLEDFHGQPCYVGLDLASRSDIAAAVLLFPMDNNKLALFGRYYLPDDAIERDLSGHYDAWVRQERLITTEGAITDMEVIVDDLVAFVSRFDVKAVCFDPWQIAPLLAALQKRGVTVPLVEIKQTVQNISPAMKELEAMVLGGLIVHDGCPVTSWMMSNVVCHYDNKDNVYPKKDRPENKIDAALASMFALNQYLADYGRVCVYDERGLIAI